jgi:hypothetical protein
VHRPALSPAPAWSNAPATADNQFIHRLFTRHGAIIHLKIHLPHPITPWGAGGGRFITEGTMRSRLVQALAYLWALPTSSIGLLFVLPALLSGGGVQWVEGVLEVYGGAVALFLRRATLLPGGASAMTLGHVVLGRDKLLLDLTRSHERVHVRQCERWGPLFLPAYILAWILAGYEGNYFERQAFGRQKARDGR